MTLIPNGPWAPLWHVFVERCFTRLRQGSIEYGDRSFALSPTRLAREIREEIADQVTWSFILDRRVERLSAALERLTHCPHCGGDIASNED